MAATTSGLFFLRRFLANPREVGALCPSTRHLGVAMVHGLDLRPGDVVLEYGPGTGALTEVIARYNAPDVRYLGIERDPGFCDILRWRFPQLEFANARVEDVRGLLAERRLPAPRAILSGLPLILLPTMHEIVTTAEAVLQAGGQFRTFSYVQSYVTRSAGRLRRLMRGTFAAFTMSRPVLRNFPPAFVLCGHKHPGA